MKTRNYGDSVMSSSLKILYTPEEIDSVVSLFNKGYSFRRIERETGISRKAVSDIVKDPEGSKKRYTDLLELPSKIRSDYINGNRTISEICKFYNIHFFTARKIIGELYDKEAHRKPLVPKQEQITKEAMEEHIKQGGTLIGFARKCGVSETCIRKWKKRFGVKLPVYEKYAQKLGYEEMTVESVRKHFIEENMPFSELPKIYGFSKKKITTFIHDNNLQKPKDLVSIIRKNTCMEKYGFEYAASAPEIRERQKKTTLERYGNTCSLQADAIKKKSLETIRKKYGNDLIVNVSQANIPRETLELINDKDRLQDYIIRNDISSAFELGGRLGLSGTEGIKLLDRFELNHLIRFVRSAPEQDLRDYVSKYFEILMNKRRIVKGVELDIYVPAKKMAIEFNGNWWHSEWKKTRLYHQNKSDAALREGIFVYHIFEYDWLSKKDLVLSQLNNLLGINTQRFYARKCEIKELGASVKDAFLEENHMQGKDKSSVKYGLFYKGELVSVMTVVKPRFNKKYEWELSRFCSKRGCNVVGGASKLFKHFILAYNPKSIITYSDKSHTKGIMYEKLGFVNVYDTQPNYVWNKGNIVLTRYQTQKKRLIAQGYTGNTEVEIMHNRKFNRIYDCGNKVWLWSVK